MKTKLLLLIIAAATLCGCDGVGNKYAYYTFVNDTDKAIVINLYEQNYYESIGMQIPEDVEPLYSFTIAAGEQFTRILPPATNKLGSDNVADPFEDLPVGGISVSNGERISLFTFLFYGYNYEVTKKTGEVVYLQYIFTDEFFDRYSRPILTE